MRCIFKRTRKYSIDRIWTCQCDLRRLTTLLYSFCLRGLSESVKMFLTTVNRKYYNQRIV